MQVLEYASANAPLIFKEFMDDVNNLGQEVNNIMRSMKVIDILLYLNDPQRIANEHSNLYLRLSQVGAGSNYFGVDTLSEWYKRNIYIFGNLQAITEPGDRILVIYGAGHMKILQEFICSYNPMELLTLEDILEGKN